MILLGIEQDFRRSWILLFTVIFLSWISCGFGTSGLQQTYADKLKAIDMEYGERLTSLEDGASHLSLHSRVREMRCTTERPLPPVDPSYVPTSDETEDDHRNKKAQPMKMQDNTVSSRPPYNGPPYPLDMLFYVDDY